MVRSSTKCVCRTGRSRADNCRRSNSISSGWILIRTVTGNPKTYRFASTGPWYVEVAGQRRISRKAAQFFLDWVYERARRIELPAGEKRDAVLKYHRAARDYWQGLLTQANTD